MAERKFSIKTLFVGVAGIVGLIVVDGVILYSTGLDVSGWVVQLLETVFG
ncbi:hypothetical protein [Marinilactibacillus piezotolerans]|nr:hypothetical protein [Marinilactibacillus piezotolerans]